VDPVDRNRRVNHRGFAWSTWEVMDNDIRKLNYQAEPIFLDNDTHQRWYWAFASQKEAFEIAKASLDDGYVSSTVYQENEEGDSVPVKTFQNDPLDK
jgi:hypothetical protein